MEVKLSTSLDTIPNEVCQYILDFVGIEQLKKLRLVSNRLNTNATALIGTKLCPLKIVFNDDQDLDNFTALVRESPHFPCRQLGIRIILETCSKQSLDIFFRHLAPLVVQCSILCDINSEDYYNHYSDVSELLVVRLVYTKLNAILQTAINLKEVELEAWGNIPAYHVPIIIPPHLEVIRLRIQHNTYAHYYHAGRQKSILSSLKPSSRQVTLELHCMCLMCLSFLLEQSLEKEYKDVSLLERLTIEPYNINDFINISQMINPSPRLSKIRLDVGNDVEFWNPLLALLNANRDYMQVLELTVRKFTHREPIMDICIPKLSRLTQLSLTTFFNGPRLKLFIKSKNLEHLTILHLSLFQNDENCPVSIVGEFKILSCLSVDSSLLSFKSCTLWLPSFPNVLKLKITVPYSVGQTTVSEGFYIPANEMNQIHHLKINFERFSDRRLDINAEWKRWMGSDSIQGLNSVDAETSNHFDNIVLGAVGGLCNLPKLKSFQVSGIGWLLYSVWVDMLAFLSRRKLLKPLCHLIVKPTSRIPVYVYKLPDDYYTALSRYHKSVKLLRLSNYS